MTLRRYKQALGVTGLILAVSCALTVLTFISARHEQTRVIALDVGQGDSTLIITQRHQYILIDGGPDSSVLNRLGRDLPFFAHSIDVVIATHPDSDHIAGLISVLGRYDVGVFIEPGIVHDSDTNRTLSDVVSKRGVPIRYADGPFDIILDQDTRLRVLYPLQSLVNTTTDDTNNASVVAQFSYGNVRALLTGDAPEAVEFLLIETYGSDLESQVLKLGHHGSNTSSSERFLETVSPALALISVGANNRYGHPAYRVLHRLDQLHIPFMRTDTMGDIRVTFGQDDFIAE